MKDVDEEDVVNEEDVPLQANVYGWAVSVIIRDAVWVQTGTNLSCLRAARVISSFLVVLSNIFLQVFLLLGVWRLCRPLRHAIQGAYSEYEYLMYPNHTVLNDEGHQRGIPGYFQEERFHLMPADAATQVCQIPLAHPHFLTVIVLVWTLSCQVQMRAIVEQLYQLLARTPTVRSIEKVLGAVDDEDTHVAKVQGLTLPLKIVITTLVQLPRLVTLVILLCLGCRWLTSTIGLSYLLLNGVALEFILNLDGLLYSVCIAHRNRIATEKLYVTPFRKLNKANFCTFFDAQVWVVASVIWALLYVYYLQQVVPDYRWDIHEACTKLHFKT